MKLYSFTKRVVIDTNVIFYDAIPEDELRNRVRKYNAENPFQGDKAVRV